MAMMCLHFDCKECGIEIEETVPARYIDIPIEEWEIPEWHKVCLISEMCPRCYPLIELTPSRN